MTHRNLALVSAVEDMWGEVVEGPKSDAKEFAEVSERRNADRTRKFVRAIRDAREVNVPWAQIAKGGVSVPTLKKYAREAGIE